MLKQTRNGFDCLRDQYGQWQPDGVTKRRVEKAVELVDDEAIMAAIGRAPPDCTGCRAVSTSAFGTTEKVKFELFRSDESRARRLLGG